MPELEPKNPHLRALFSGESYEDLENSRTQRLAANFLEDLVDCGIYESMRLYGVEDILGRRKRLWFSAEKKTVF